MDKQVESKPKSNNDNKNLILIVAMVAIGIMILIIAIAGINNSKKDSSENTDNSVSLNAEQPPVSEVYVTGSGIDPQKITVTVGSQVKFTNKTESPIELIQSPADEKSLQEFNLDEKLTLESSYAYAFEEEGTFNIQDKNDPAKWNIAVEVRAN